MMDCDTGTNALMTAGELGDYLRVTKKAVYEMVHKGVIPPRGIVRIGRRLRFRRESIDQWITKQAEQ